MSDDLDRERARRLSPMPSPPSHRGGGSAAFVGRVVTPPGTVGQFFTVNPVAVTGVEVAGGAGTLTVDTGTLVPVYFVGAGVPNVGDDLVCSFVDYRWVAEKRGCPIYVDPLDSYGHPIVGAQVTAYWNAATKGAFADPTLNDTSVGPFTTTGGQMKIPVDSTNGVYLVKIVATGYATQYYYMFGCGKHCADAFPPPISSPQSVPTTKNITTNVQTTSCAYQVATGLAAAPSGLPISGTAAWNPSWNPHPGVASYFPQQNIVTGGAFPVIGSFSGSTCPAPTDWTPGVIQIACLDSFNLANHQVVTAHFYFVPCPVPSGTPSSIAPTDYATGVYAFTLPATLGSAITNIQFSPAKVEGTWDTTYSPTGGILKGSTFVPYSQPGPSLTPLTGSWTIQ